MGRRTVVVREVLDGEVVEWLKAVREQE